MKGRAWIIPVALLVVVAGLVLLVPNKPSSCPDHRSDCDAPDGTSALMQLASAMGHPARPMTGSFAMPDSSGLLFVFTPDADAEVTSDQAAQLADWVTRGGTLVYADNTPNVALDRRLRVDRGVLVRGAIGEQGPDPLQFVALPVMAGVDSVEGGPTAATLRPSAGQVSLIRARTVARAVVGYQEASGRGRLVVLGDPQVLSNGSLKRLDNGHLAEDLVDLAPAGAPIVFDEFHHNAGAPAESMNDWALTSWGPGVVWVLLVMYLGLLLRGRAFGPQLPIHAARQRSSAEYASAVGGLLRRARARGLTLNVLLDSTRRALAERTGLGYAATAERLMPALDKRAPDLARRLRAAEQTGAGADRSDSELLRAAQQLHSLAYPSAKSKP